MNYLNNEDTICAITTGGGMSAIAIIRVSGKHAINITNSIFSKEIVDKESHTIHFGTILENDSVIDEVLVSIFKNEKSFTGEESIEISCHGSVYIQNKIIHLLLKKGCRIATAGEFTMRAFKNGKIDLSQAESIADLIASEGKASHEIALKQLRGGFSNKLKILRSKLIDFASLIELELDFSEEDVEFADRNEFINLLESIKDEVQKLIKSFGLGNVIKEGIPVAILGAPNVGKSTLLNRLFNEEKAIVSDIAGTTRDAIEDELNIDGFKFRFIDTAGIRETNDTIENLGIEKTIEKAKKSNVLLLVIEPKDNINSQLEKIKKLEEDTENKTLIVVNKIDLNPKINKNKDAIYISAKNNTGITTLKKRLLDFAGLNNLSYQDTIITNHRHYNELNLALKEIEAIMDGIKHGISGDFLAINLRQSLFHIGNITGEITTDTVLGNIFGKFCIGK